MGNPVVAAALLLFAFTGACATEGTSEDDVQLGEVETEVIGSNKLALNKLALNKLALNKLALNKLALNSLEVQDMMSSEDGRFLVAYVISCAIPAGQSVTVQDPSGVSYTYPGAFGLAAGWATRVPTVSERRWVTACILARTNVYGQQVQISLRHDFQPGLNITTSAERNTYSKVEGAFFGDLFASIPVTFACSARAWTPVPAAGFRACAMQENGNASWTDCHFAHPGACTSTSVCSDRTPPFGSCKGSGVTYSEVVTIYLTPTQQQGSLF